MRVEMTIIVMGEPNHLSKDEVLMSFDKNDQADRAISTGRLRRLPCFHLRPIDVVVYHGS